MGGSMGGLSALVYCVSPEMRVAYNNAVLAALD